MIAFTVMCGKKFARREQEKSCRTRRPNAQVEWLNDTHVAYVEIVGVSVSVC
jgi:hypothetical protein